MPFLSTTVSVADCPAFSRFVTLPVHELALVTATVRVQILKSCASLPLFVTLKMTVPGVIRDVFESLNESSLGFPAVTVTVATLAAELCPEADPLPTVSNQAKSPTAAAMKTTVPIVKDLRCVPRAGSFLSPVLTQSLR